MSVIVPAYNEASRLSHTLERVVAYLRPRHLFEALVVDDGSTDGTAALVRSVTQRLPEVRLVSLPRRQGKGAAVKAGIAQAAGRWLCVTDADLAISIEQFERALPLLQHGAHMVIGSRALPGSTTVPRQRFLRRWLGRSFHLVVRALLGVRFRDTQCGFKCFEREAAQAIFARVATTGFAFDVEVLLLAEEMGLQIQEIPVHVENDQTSTVRPFEHAGATCRDLWRMARRYRGRQGTAAARHPAIPSW